MTVRNLEYLFRPGSIAVIAEPEEPSSYADLVQRNLAAGGFTGPLALVAARRATRLRLGPRVRVDPLPFVPDLALICAHFESIPAIVAQLGERGVRAAIIGPSIRDKLSATEFSAVRKAILEAARPHLMRIVGPNTIGALSPLVNLNASFTHLAPKPGGLGLISQSGAVVSSIVDWAAGEGVGFSQLISLGDMADVDVGDCINWLAADRATTSILIYLESIPEPRKFMSGGRAAARPPGFRWCSMCCSQA